MNDDDKFDYLFKIVLIGDCGVGKTSVVNRFRSGTYTDRYTNTIGVDFTMKTLMVDKAKVKLQIWDTAGQERFRTITQSYYRSANGIIVVYDITQRSSFENINEWIKEVKRYTTAAVPILLVGNKNDMETEREVPYLYAKQVANSISNIIDVIETSAKEDTNIESVFMKLAEELKQSHNAGDHIRSQGNESISLNSNPVHIKVPCCK